PTHMRLAMHSDMIAVVLIDLTFILEGSAARIRLLSQNQLARCGSRARGAWPSCARTPAPRPCAAMSYTMAPSQSVSPTCTLHDARWRRAPNLVHAVGMLCRQAARLCEWPTHAIALLYNPMTAARQLLDQRLPASSTARLGCCHYIHMAL